VNARRICSWCVGTVVAIALFITPAIAVAATINVDFNGNPIASNNAALTYSGTAAAPDTGTIWNGLYIGTTSVIPTYTSGPSTIFNTSATPTTIVTSTGTPTSIQVTLTNFRGFDIGGPDNLLREFPAGAASGTEHINGFTISGLTPNGLYDLYIYSQNGSAGNAQSEFTITTPQQVLANETQQNVINAGGGSSLVLGRNYIAFTNLISYDGTLSGEVRSLLATNASAFNGFQLVEKGIIPEPASLGLVTLVGGVLMLRRRKMA
jgi:hypothetical protein